LSLAAVGNDQVLSWSAPSDNGNPITDYAIEYQMHSWMYWYPFDDGVSTTTSATVSDLGAGYYNFRVRAVNADGVGAPSSSVTMNTYSTDRLLSYTTPGTYTPKATATSSTHYATLVGGGGGHHGVRGAEIDAQRAAHVAS